MVVFFYYFIYFYVNSINFITINKFRLFLTLPFLLFVSCNEDREESLFVADISKQDSPNNL